MSIRLKNRLMDFPFRQLYHLVSIVFSTHLSCNMLCDDFWISACPAALCWFLEVTLHCATPIACQLISSCSKFEVEPTTSHNAGSSVIVTEWLLLNIQWSVLYWTLTIPQALTTSVHTMWVWCCSYRTSEVPSLAVCPISPLRFAPLIVVLVKLFVGL